MDTFTVQDADDRRLFSQELPNTAVTGHPYLSHIAPMAIFNPTGSGVNVRVRRAEVMPLMAQTTTTPGNLDLYRITAHTGAADAITPASLDSSNAALPSQVVLARRPATVTTTGTMLASGRAMPLANDTLALGYSFAATPWAKQLSRLDATTAELQRIVLREGEGICVTMNSVCGLVYRFMVSVTVRVVATGACYRYTFPATATGLPTFSLLNGASSGVVLEVCEMAYQQIGTDVLPQIALEPIDGIGDGDTLTPVAHDSAGSIGAIIARRNCAILMKGAKSGALISVPHQAWQVSGGYGAGPAVGNLTGDMAFFRKLQPHASELDIVLREGEGLAITYKNAGSLGRMRHSFTFSIDTGGGAVYPTQPDVRDGITYGPTGADYTGSLVAGSGMSRGRVTNA